MTAANIIENLQRLSSIHKTKDFKKSKAYMSAGPHCPLKGVSSAVYSIEGAFSLIIGTSECTAYSKSMENALQSLARNNSAAVVLSESDVTFGSLQSVEKAFAQIYTEYAPTCVFLITTCVVEIIGDDMHSLAQELSERYKIPVIAIQTEHFTGVDSTVGTEKVLTACFEMMEPCTQNNSVNILGGNFGDVTRTELYTLLHEENIPINLLLPRNWSAKIFTAEDIKKAARARLNIVISRAGVPLAEKMRERFGIPYILHLKTLDPQLNLEAYSGIFASLEKELPAQVNELFSTAQERSEELRALVQGKTLAYGHGPVDKYAFCAYFSRLGMKTLFMHAGDLEEHDLPYKEEICQHSDPYILHGQQDAVNKKILSVLKPDLFVAYDRDNSAKKQGIAAFKAYDLWFKHGFEMALHTFDSIENAFALAIQYKQKMQENSPGTAI